MTLLLLLPLVVGGLLWARLPERDPLESLALAVPLGAGVAAWMALALSSFGGMLGPVLPLLLLALGLAAAPRRPSPAAAARERVSPLAWGCLALAAAQVAMVVALALAEGRLVDWDAWAIWDMKARAFFVDGGVDGYLERSVALEFSWPSRPPLTALAQAFLYTALGGSSETAGRLLHAAIYASLLAFFFALVRRSCDTTPAAVGTALLATLPNVAYHATSGVANLALGVYLLAQIVALLHAFDRGGRWAFAVAGIGAGLACLARDEGRWLACLAAVATTLVAWRLGCPRRRMLAGLSAATLVAAALYAPWAMAVARHGAADVLSQWTAGETLARIPAHARDLPAFVRLLGPELLEPVEQSGASPFEGWLGLALFWPTFAVAAVAMPFAGRRDPLAVSAAFTTVGGLLFYAAGLWLFPYQSLADLHHDWLYVLDRHLIAVTPAAAYAIVSALSPPRREASSASPLSRTPASVSQPPTATERGA